jgi:hypothetical protein
MAVQLQTGKNGFIAFLYQACVPSIPSPPCSCGLDHRTSKHIIIHCRYFSASGQALRVNQSHFSDYTQLIMTLIGLKKVSSWVIKRGMLGQYQRAGCL